MEKLYKKTSKQEMAQNKCLTLNLITTKGQRETKERKNIYFLKSKKIKKEE